PGEIARRVQEQGRYLQDPRDGAGRQGLASAAGRSLPVHQVIRIHRDEKALPSGGAFFVGRLARATPDRKLPSARHNQKTRTFGRLGRMSMKINNVARLGGILAAAVGLTAAGVMAVAQAQQSPGPLKIGVMDGFSGVYGDL